MKLFERLLTDKNIEKLTEWFVNSLEQIGIKGIFIFILIICFAILLLVTIYVRKLNMTTVELLFLEKKESIKNDFANAVTLFWVMGIANVFLSITEEYIIFGLFVIILLGIIIVIQKVFKCINHKRIEKDLPVFFMITSGPIMVLVCEYNLKIDRVVCCIFVTLIETFIFLLSSGINCSYVYFEIADKETTKEEKWYAYRKLNEKYIMCGNNRNLEDADEIKMILIEDVLDCKYLIKKEKTQKEPIFINKGKKKDISENDK